MRRAGRSRLVLAAALAASCSGPDAGAPDARDDAGPADDARRDDARPVDAAPDTGSTARILFQCTPFDGGLCSIAADGSDRRQHHATGFVPHATPAGAILFHTAAYRVARRHPGGAIDDLGDGAFARPHPDGGVLFQCSGLGGGLCTMAADGSQRRQLRATGRVPDIDDAGRVLFHTDAYRVIRRAADGTERDLGDGAFATWTADGRVLFQCSGLGGGLCRMAADGTQRETLAPAGRVPDAEATDRIVFHTDAYQLTLRAGQDVRSLGPGANATWW